MKKADVWIQFADLSAEDLHAHDHYEAAKLFEKFDWDSQDRFFNELESKGKDNCPPGIGIRKKSGEFLHICLQKKDLFFTFIDIPKKTRLLGFIPFTRNLHWDLRNLSKSNILEIMNNYYKLETSNFINWVESEMKHYA